MDPDVLIIGGGLIGLSLARELRRNGVARVTLIERGSCGEESSWAAAGMLGPQTEADTDDEMLRFCIASRELYPRFAAELTEETGIEVELDRAGTLYLAFTEDEAMRLAARAAWQNAAGYRAERLTGRETAKAEPFVSPDVMESVLFPDDWQIENRKLCRALRRYADINQITVLENTEVVELLNERGLVSGVRTRVGEIKAGMTVLTTGAWTSLIKLGAFPVPVSIKPVRGQMICYRTAKRLFERVIYSHNGYLVPRADGRLLAGATSAEAGFNKEVNDADTAALVHSATRIAPALAGQNIVDSWAGLRPCSVDGLPVLGQFTGLDGLFIATGHYRNGILLAPLTAQMMAGLIVDGRSSDFIEAFGPDRFHNAAARG